MKLSDFASAKALEAEHEALRAIWKKLNEGNQNSRIAHISFGYFEDSLATVTYSAKPINQARVTRLIAIMLDAMQQHVKLELEDVEASLAKIGVDVAA